MARYNSLSRVFVLPPDSLGLSGPLSLLHVPRSANHISVRRVTCFPVLQQPTVHDALQQIYQLVFTSPRLLRRSVISATFNRMHSSCVRGSFDLSFALSVRPPLTYFDGPGKFGTHVLDFICLRNQRVASCRLTPWLFYAWKLRWRMLVT